MKRDRLGKGLGALLGDYLEPQSAPADVRRVPVSAIVPNPLQPRKEFSEEDLSELVASIQESGLLQPLLVRPVKSRPDRFELVAGERRFRSVQRLGWEDVPVLVREMNDETLLVLALVENIQRAQLSPLEEAEGYQTLLEQFKLTQDEVAKAVGKSRSTVANLLRLLNLPTSIRRRVQSGELTMGHARALLSVDDVARAVDLAARAVAEGWSVREMERRTRSEAASPKAKSSKQGSSADRAARDPVLSALEEALCESLATRVRLRGAQAQAGKGWIEIPFDSRLEFERVFALISGREASDVVQ